MSYIFLKKINRLPEAPLKIEKQALKSKDLFTSLYSLNEKETKEINHFFLRQYTPQKYSKQLIIQPIGKFQIVSISSLKIKTKPKISWKIIQCQALVKHHYQKKEKQFPLTLYYLIPLKNSHTLQKGKIKNFTKNNAPQILHIFKSKEKLNLNLITIQAKHPKHPQEILNPKQIKEYLKQTN